jgi:hypothetical protein
MNRVASGNERAMVSAASPRCWQQFTVSGTLQNGLTAVAFQLGGDHTITGGQVYDVWGAEMWPGTASGGVVTNILPSSELVAGSSWVINNGSGSLYPWSFIPASTFLHTLYDLLPDIAGDHSRAFQLELMGASGFRAQF